MANHEELWIKEFAKASRIADEISKMLSEHGSLHSSDPATKRHLSHIRRCITILSTRLLNLEMEADYARIPKEIKWDKNMLKRKEMLSNLRKREKQMVSVLEMWCAAKNPKDLPGTSKCSVDEVKTSMIWRDRERGLAAVLDDNRRIISVQRQIMKEQDEVLHDNQHTISVQRQIMKEQDEVLDRLEEIVLVMKNFALALYEKLNS